MSEHDGDAWSAVGTLSDLPEGRSTRVQVGGIDVLLVRSGQRVFAVGNRCSHQGAPLDRGVARVDGPMPTVTCPAHGSVFSLEDGAVRRGPASHPVPAFDVRMDDGSVQIRARSDGPATPA
jgi:nitrite reductase/ring-hydroxylating ferredoxin subunit